MRFGERIKEEMLPEWAAHYIDYAHMKELIGDVTLDTEAFVEAMLSELRAQLERAERHMAEMVEQLRCHCDELAKETANDAFHELVTAARSPTASGRTIFPRRMMKQPSAAKAILLSHQRENSSRRRGGSPAPLVPTGEGLRSGATELDSLVGGGPHAAIPVPPAAEATRGSSYGSVGLTSGPAGGGGCGGGGGDHRSHSGSLHGSLSSADLMHAEGSATEGKAQRSAKARRAREAKSFKGFFNRFLQNPTDALGGGDATANARRRYAEWYSSATRLIHFAELNIEAMHKTCKKANKVRPSARIKARLASEVAHNKLHEGIEAVHAMMERVKRDYHSRFADELQQYAGVTMPSAEAWGCRWRYVALAGALYVVARCAPMPVFAGHAPAHHCFALFVLTVTLWVTEAMPFFCTAMLIPIIAVPTGIIRDPIAAAMGQEVAASPEVASKVLMGRIFDHVQILVLGGLVIAKAMSRTQLEHAIAQQLHQRTAHSPRLYLLGIMLLSCLMSIFVSNIASPLLTLGVIQSTLWEFPSGSSAPQGILLALAFSCNIGGMLSPISSPQNAVAMQVLSSSDVTFSKWMLTTLPLAIAGVVAAWGLILALWRPFDGIDSIPLQNRPRGPPVPRIHVHIVVATTLATIILWVLPAGKNIFGDAGVVALIPLVVFFGCGILKKEDFNKLSWHLMFLLAGGNMLGTCAKDSKMLDMMVGGLKGQLSTEPPFVTLWAVLLCVLAVTTFVSHTVAAMILLPVIAKIGAFLPAAAAPFPASLLAISPEALVFLSTLMCSSAMAFPVSSFPNINSLLAEDETGRPYLRARDFLVPGAAITVFLGVCGGTWMVPWFNFVSDHM